MKLLLIHIHILLCHLVSAIVLVVLDVTVIKLFLGITFAVMFKSGKNSFHSCFTYLRLWIVLCTFVPLRW